MPRPALLLALALAGCTSSHGPADCAGSLPACYPVSSEPGCCLDDPTDALCEGGAWVCPSGRQPRDECGRIDRLCEPLGSDGGPAPLDGGPAPLDGGPAPGDYYACTVPSECVITPTSCCGTCSRPTTRDVASVARSRQRDYYLDVACPEARSGPPPCPACVPLSNPNLVATCASGTCETIDVEADRRFSECAIDADCVIRTPACCECGADTSPGQLVALRASAVADYERAVCDPGTGCPECAPRYPADVQARCVAGLCRVILPGRP